MYDFSHKKRSHRAFFDIIMQVSFENRYRVLEELLGYEISEFIHPKLLRKEIIMNITIQDINFSIKEELVAYVERKIGKLARFHSDISNVAVTLTLIKPETKENKKVRVAVSAPGKSFFSEKCSDTFEEAVSEVCDAIISQIERQKEQHNH